MYLYLKFRPNIHMAGNIILKYNKDENVKSISTYHIVILIKQTKETKQKIVFMFVRYTA